MSSIPKLSKLPFFSWECITLYTKMYTIDLVIRNQEAMDKFIKLIIYHMNTIDNQKGTALKIKELITK